MTPSLELSRSMIEIASVASEVSRYSVRPPDVTDDSSQLYWSMSSRQRARPALSSPSSTGRSGMPCCSMVVSEASRKAQRSSAGMGRDASGKAALISER